MLKSVFVCYRRSTSGWARLIHDRLSSRFGSQCVFLDVEDIRFGDDFPQRLTSTIADCAAMIVIIGQGWKISDDGEPAVQDNKPVDHVRVEIATALTHDVALLPVIVDGGVMPDPSNLPADVKALANVHARVIPSDDLMNTAIERMLEDVDAEFSGAGSAKSTSKRSTLMLGAFSIGTLATALYFLDPLSNTDSVSAPEVRSVTVQEDTQHALPPADIHTDGAEELAMALPKTQPSSAKPEVSAEYIKALQRELNRLGCNLGPVDGKVGPRTEGRLSEVRQLLKTDLKWTDERFLSLMSLRTDQLCSPSCRVTETLRAGKCVRKKCRTGQRLNSAGKCYTPNPQPQTTSPSRCWIFNGELTCP